MTMEMLSKSINFEEIARAYYRAWFRFHPEAAVKVGVRGYGHLLTPYTEDERGALVYLNDALIVALEELARDGLSVDEQLDRDILYNAARLENEYLLDVEPQRLDPGRILPCNAIYQLLIRPVEDFPTCLMARLDAIAPHLLGARAYLAAAVAAIPPLWADSAATAAHAGVRFLQDLPDHPKVKAHAHHLGGLDATLRTAAQALTEYGDFLVRDIVGHARGDFACGGSYFEHLLRRRHFIDISVDEVRALGVRLFDETQAELAAACRELGGHDNVAALTRRINAEHPPAERLLHIYREQMQAAQAFVHERDLVSVPIAAHLEVAATPLFLRHQIPFAAYSEPSPNDPGQQGYYYVTPPVDDAQLTAHHHTAIMHTCVHEAWPGHHLQFVTANQIPAARSLPRLLNPSATLYEGWALYSEQLMHEHGFLARPESRFLLLKDRLWRALRVLLDVDLHTRGLSLDSAVGLMTRHLGFSASQALADLTWYTRSPTVPLSYATGWSIINSVREQLRHNRPGFNLKQFHDQLLSQGSVALPRVVRRVYGEAMWTAVRQHLVRGAVNETA